MFQTEEREPAARRAQALARLNILDSPREQLFDDLVQIVAGLLEVPLVALSMMDGDRQWFKASVGLAVNETDRALSFCNIVVDQREPLMVPDARVDVRLSESPLVTGAPFVRSYLGVPIYGFGEIIGALCVAGTEPREFSRDDLEALHKCARQADALLEMRWRRTLSDAPHQSAVEDMAARIATQRDFDELLGADERPAWISDQQTLRFLAVNDATVEQYGWSRDEFLSMTILEIRGERDAEALKETLQNITDGKSVMPRIWRHHRRDGIPMDIHITHADGMFEGAPSRCVFATNVTAQWSKEQALHHAALHDSLTGLPNRRMFFELMDRTLSSPLDLPLVLLFIDLDQFKNINDTDGHDAGDLLLAAAAARLAMTLDPGHTLARLGGDEFAVQCPMLTTAQGIEVAERLCRELRRPFHIRHREYLLTASIGVSRRHPTSTPRSMLMEADSAMYAAKSAGRDQVTLFNQQLRDRLDSWAEVKRQLHEALEHDEFEIELQPIVDLMSDEISFEALVRWNHPTRGRLLPNKFLSVAEESMLIVPLGRRVLDMSTRCAAALTSASNFGHVSVNVSAVQFNDRLVGEVAASLAESGCPPERLVIEITESVFRDERLAEATLRGLAALGVGIWIDDFGTGYSSLSRLRWRPVTGVKIDRSFTNDLHDAGTRSITDTILHLATGLGITAVAEGIETPDQLEALRSLGCRFVQGFLVGRPSSLDDALAMLDPSSAPAYSSERR